jgi:hypothetical protein
MGSADERDALRDAEARMRQVTAEIELLRYAPAHSSDLGRKIDEAAELMERIGSRVATSSRSCTKRAGK